MKYLKKILKAGVVLLAYQFVIVKAGVSLALMIGIPILCINFLITEEIVSTKKFPSEILSDKGTIKNPLNIFKDLFKWVIA